MATLVGKESDTIKLLHDLCELDHDAIEAYEAAIQRLDSEDFKRNLRNFCDDHRRHVSDLNSVIRQLGGEAVEKGDFKRILTKGKVVLGGLAGDRAIMMAMKTNEDDTNKAYERAVGHGGFDANVKALLEKNLQDERRHRSYIEQALGTMKDRTSRPSMSGGEGRVSSQSIV